MALQIWFWVIYVLSLVFSIWTGRDEANPYPYKRWGGSLLFYILIGILGYAAFGSPIK